MRKAFLFAVCVVVCSGFGAEALAEYDGNDLLDKCQVYLDGQATLADNLDWGLCLGYVAATRDTAQELARYYLVNSIFCLPNGVEPKQEIRVVVKYLENNPAKLHEGGVMLILGAFREAFPCTGD